MGPVDLILLPSIVAVFVARCQKRPAIVCDFNLLEGASLQHYPWRQRPAQRGFRHYLLASTEVATPNWLWISNVWNGWKSSIVFKHGWDDHANTPTYTQPRDHWAPQHDTVNKTGWNRKRSGPTSAWTQEDMRTSYTEPETRENKSTLQYSYAPRRVTTGPEAIAFTTFKRRRVQPTSINWISSKPPSRGKSHPSPS